MIPEFKGDVIQWLRGFYCLATAKDMKEAMYEMNRTQSALAYQIRSLEKIFGAKLFKVNAEGRHLTEEGKILFEKTQHIFNVLEKTKINIVKLPEIVSGEIKMVAIYTALQAFLADKAKPFSERFPHVTFCIFAEACMNPMLDMVKKGICDMAILSVEKVPHEFVQIPLFKTEVSLISPQKGPFSVTSQSSLEEISRLPCIYTMDNTTIQIFLEKEFAKYNLRMNKTHLISHYEGAKAYVSKGYGITFLDSFACSEEDHAKYNIVSMYPYFPKRTMSAVIKRNRFIPSYQQAFLDFISNGYVAEEAV